MLKISYAGCPGLSPAISAQLTLKICVAARNREKFTKNPHFGGLRSFKVIDVDKFEKPVTSACYDKQHICNRFHTKRADSGKITSFRGVTLFEALVRREPSHPTA